MPPRNMLGIRQIMQPRVDVDSRNWKSSHAKTTKSGDEYFMAVGVIERHARANGQHHCE
ncbi:MAG: hypothetical protein OXF20_13115 [Gammaproteobacteria bacterium]|nr:hypothetical protein [Gammaproteobacteria bacterium]